MSEDMVPLKEAETQVKVVTIRLALLHLAFSKTLVESFGWEQGKQLILDSIKRYGEYVAERTKKGYQGLPKYGFWEQRKGRPPLCELGKVMLEMGEMEIGSLYCLIDPAKTMAADINSKLIHTKNMILGDDECEFANVSTTDEDKSNFTTGKDWLMVDPVIAKKLSKKKK